MRWWWLSASRRGIRHDASPPQTLRIRRGTGDWPAYAHAARWRGAQAKTPGYSVLGLRLERLLQAAAVRAASAPHRRVSACGLRHHFAASELGSFPDDALVPGLLEGAFRLDVFDGHFGPAPGPSCPGAERGRALRERVPAVSRRRERDPRRAAGHDAAPAEPSGRGRPMERSGAFLHREARDQVYGDAGLPVARAGGRSLGGGGLFAGDA